MIGGIIYKARRTGMANRLRAYVGYKAVAAHLDVPFAVYWEPRPGCPAEFSDIFDSSSVTLLDAGQCNELECSREFVGCEDYQWFDAIIKQAASQYKEVTESDVYRHVPRAIASIKPSSAVASLMDDVCSGCELSQCVGFHVRHTDNIAQYATWSDRSADFDPSRVSTFDGFVAAAQAFASSRPLFLATDCESVEKMFLSQFGTRVVLLPKTFSAARRGYKRTTSMTAAAADFFLLSKCQTVVGTYYSSFSKLASIFGTGDFWEVTDKTWSRNELVARCSSLINRGKILL